MSSFRIPIEFIRTRDGAILPQYGSVGAAAMDVAAYVESSVPLIAFPGKTLKVPTGFKFYVRDPDYAMFLLSRSGLGSKGIVLPHAVGLIDSDYQGELLVTIYNRSSEPFVIHHGDRIAQMLFMPIVHARFMEVQSFSERTERGDGGFGSTGVKVAA